MKKIFALVLALSTIVLLADPMKESEKVKIEAPSKSDKAVYIKASNIKKETIAVTGMTCLGCEITLEKEILKIKGVVRAKASSTANNVVVEYDTTKTNKMGLIHAIKNAGYKAQE